MGDCCMQQYHFIISDMKMLIFTVLSLPFPSQPPFSSHPLLFLLCCAKVYTNTDTMGYKSISDKDLVVASNAYG